MNAQLAERPSTDLAILPPVERAQSILKSSDLAPKLIALAEESKHIVAITNPAGREQVHAKRMVLKNQRIAIRKAGKAARDDANKFADAVIEAEDSLVALVEPEETRLETLQGEWDAKIEAEKEAERKRQQQIIDDARAVIQWFRDQATDAVLRSSTEIADMLRVVEHAPLSGLPEQFIREGEAAKTIAIAKLGDMYAARNGFEIEQAELQVQQQILDEQKRVQADEQARVNKQAEDERAELLAISKILTSCIGRESAFILHSIKDFEADPPIKPTAAVTAAYEDALVKLKQLRDQAKDREDAIKRDADARAERDRIEAIKGRIADIRQKAREGVGKSTEAISVLLTELEATPANFEEFCSDALSALEETRSELRRLYGDAQERERMDADFRAQVNADANRKAQEAADKRAADEKAEKDAAELARVETQRLIAECTLRDAAVLVLILLREHGLGEVVAAKMLESAIERAA